MSLRTERIAGSFRDPSGFLFRRGGALLRQVNQAYRPHYDFLLESGLYEDLSARGWLVPHAEVQVEALLPQIAYKVIQPTELEFISYPYEWSFSQLKDAALHTLKVTRRALDRGMVLKDASAYNVQFHQGHPVLIDTLSFEIYHEGQPWIAYRQFCQHFLAPLALMSRVDVRLGDLLRIHQDGIPLDLASRLLPRGSWLNPPLLLHLHLHARAQARFAGRAVAEEGQRRKMDRNALVGLLDSLRGYVQKASLGGQTTAWSNYEELHNYSPEALAAKRHIVADYLEIAGPSTLWDLGANTGDFSRLASGRGILTVSIDSDPVAVERNYLRAVQEGDGSLLPLRVDLTNPSPSQGWAHQERHSLLERGPADAVMALALVHHLAIGNNLPLDRIAEFLRALGRWLIIEFVPKSDPQVVQLMAARKDIFDDYTETGFEHAFGTYYDIRRSEMVSGTERRLFLMEVKT